MSIVDATRSYETWLAGHTRIVAADLALKHEKMASDPFVFFRATFYRWLQLWHLDSAGRQPAPQVSAVGDVHVENFGTWRDGEGRLVWGVNDLDEACELPYVHDLVRLATSASLALRVGEFDVSVKALCDAILDGYSASIERGGRPIVLAERHRWLQGIAIEEIRNPAEFWEKLREAPVTRARDCREAFDASFPEGTTAIRVSRRVAGAGSLGRARFVAIGLLGGSAIAREAKARVPSAAVWLGAEDRSPFVLFKGAARVADPLITEHGAWMVRRLAPDCVKIDVSELPRDRDEQKLLRAMGVELANLHVRRQSRAAILDDLGRRPEHWLRTSAQAMTEVVLRDFRDWQRHHRRA